MPIYVLFLLFSVIIATTSMFFLMPRKDQLEQRKEQSRNLFRENVLSKQIDKVVEKRVRFSRRYNKETICLQAGIPLKYVELVMISILSGVVIGVTLGFFMTNPILGILFTFLGYMAPFQVITFLRNRRVDIVDRQVGSFMHMLLSRYETTRDFAKSIELSADEFKGEEPLHGHLQNAVMELNIGRSTNDVMTELARRTGNKYVQRLADYYEIASEVGTKAIRQNLLQQAYVQYEENRKGKQMMKKELSAVKREAYIMLAAIPAFAAFQMLTNDDYVRFMTKDPLGQIGTSGIMLVFVGALWFINKKISAPLE